MNEIIVAWAAVVVAMVGVNVVGPLPALALVTAVAAEAGLGGYPVDRL
jgi:hypothetical protein